MYEKIAKCRSSQPSSLIHNKVRNRVKTVSTQPQSPECSREKLVQKRIKTNEIKEKQILFMGHDYIDGVKFKIKLIIANGTFHLIGTNEHTDIRTHRSLQKH